MTKKYVARVQKFVPLLKAAPYCMVEAADYLAAWVAGAAPHSPLLDVSSCSVQQTSAVAAVGVCGPTVGASPIPDGAEGDLDPAPWIVVLAPAARRHVQRAPRPAHRASVLDEQSTLVYTCAVSLFQNQGINMVDAIAMGEKCWREFQAASASEPRAIIQGDGGAHGPAREDGNQARRAGRARQGKAGESFAADVPDGSDDEVGGAGILDIVGMGDALDLAP